MDKAPDSITHGKSAPVVTPEGPELAASGWLGTHDLPPDLTRWAEMDEKARAAAVKLTGGVSPVSLALAWADWAMHLSLAPGKRMQLAEITHHLGVPDMLEHAYRSDLVEGLCGCQRTVIAQLHPHPTLQTFVGNQLLHIGMLVA